MQDDSQASHAVALEEVLNTTAFNSNSDALCKTFVLIFNDTMLDAGSHEKALIMPSEALLTEQIDVIEQEAIHGGRQYLSGKLGRALKDDLLEAYCRRHTRFFRCHCGDHSSGNR